MQKYNIYSKGFTLVETIVTIVIIAILAVICVPLYFTHVERARGSEALENLHLMRSAEILFMPANSGYTNDTAVLQTYTNFSLNDLNWIYTIEGVTDTTFLAVATSLSPNPAYAGKRITLDQDSIVEFDNVEFADGGSWPP